ncbi:hypothetical protein Lal_00008088 [Lupinus albus]|nr:hypothetical protein Lal_00008088 [Lupinus albus]
MVSVASMATATDSASPLTALSPSPSLPIPSSKVSEKNYLTWSQVMIVILKFNRAIPFIQPTEIPPRFLSESDREHQLPNPSFLSWEKQDQTIFSWILNFIFESLHTRVLGCTSSC